MYLPFLSDAYPDILGVLVSWQYTPCSCRLSKSTRSSSSVVFNLGRHLSPHNQAALSLRFISSRQGPHFYCEFNFMTYYGEMVDENAHRMLGARWAFTSRGCEPILDRPEGLNYIALRKNSTPSRSLPQPCFISLFYF
ncbi:uncharacterized protein STEHIDRAFT_131882 [Stereum hirsutum FP-91666 SS1]|uniref:uncharacterized protein n=1 Tax=Stereum hirsutum (strain FP-91666) TaxID=721885 RepID=UPI0004449335|nr:uncharacterized protein STEHIDRAFT_131882 [Stereum hirsutum FP-91666 SS1]EIM86311.1 hypothetical protein STEHIDRAFT_131882 [Stereum hirsutum FP-91666 SS1]